MAYKKNPISYKASKACMKLDAFIENKDENKDENKEILP